MAFHFSDFRQIRLSTVKAKLMHKINTEHSRPRLQITASDGARPSSSVKGGQNLTSEFFACRAAQRGGGQFHAGHLDDRACRVLVGEQEVLAFSKYQVLDLTTKGTIRNKEIFNRNHYQRLSDVELASFTERIDLWVLEFAELYAAKS